MGYSAVLEIRDISVRDMKKKESIIVWMKYENKLKRSSVFLLLFSGVFLSN